MFDREATVSPALVRAMADSIVHRGPDDDGYYFSGPVGLGFRRLSIIDLSLGHQPLSNEDESVWVVFNGEIYNYQELRTFLLSKGHTFRTDTDTEVIVHLYEELGEACVERLRGMFAFAIWDGRDQSLFVARDRVGIKPLYYHISHKAVIFGSEIKAILVDPTVQAEMDPSLIDRFLTFNYLAGDETMLRNIRKLPPGSSMMVRNGKVTIRQYWDLAVAPSKLSLAEAEYQLQELTEETVKLHMISDVPVGFLLSGGFDSTSLLSMATDVAGRQLSTFTVGFSDPCVVDERPYARLASKRFGTAHHEVSITARDFEQFLPKYVWFMEEPVCEPPAVALFYVSRLARESVKVLISGEGGDEAFAGYQVYRNLLWIHRLRNGLGPLKGLAAAAAALINRGLRSRAIDRFIPHLGKSAESEYGGHSNPFGAGTNDDLYTETQRKLTDRKFSFEALTRYAAAAPQEDFVNRMLYIDTKSWLADDLLVKADKMTMANSIELRVPFLDHRVLEFAASLPGNFKVRGGATKFLAKKAFGHRVPKEIVNRKKVGFPVPYESWLRQELRDWVRDVLLDSKTVQRGYFKKASIERLLLDDQETRRHSKVLFSLLTLELWHRTFLDTKSNTGFGVHAASPNAVI